MQSVRNINVVYGDQTTNIKQCQQWFQKTKQNLLEDNTFPERSLEFREDILQTVGE